MNKIISPLRLGNVGQPVADLQAGLAVLGFSIVSSEVTSQTFGASTQLAVQAFQGREHFQATGGVDAPTAARLNHRLAAPAEDRFFSVQGEVVRPDGKPLPGHRVHAFDRALCDWRELVDTRVNEVRTDKAGRYRIVYDPAQLEAWGKTRADLKVEISDPSDDVVLAQSPLILSALPQELVNFAIGDQLYRGPDEYTQVEAGLAPQLGSLADLSCLGAADVLILARDAKLPSSSVAYYVKAQRWASELNAPAALFYGLMRRNQPTRSGALLTRPLRRLWSALEEANAQNIIQLPLDAELRTRLADIQQHYLAQPEHPHTQLLNTTALSTEQQSVFTRLFTSGELTGDAFWSSLEADSDFSAAQVTELRNTFALQAFAANNTSLTIQLRSVLNVRAAREVAAFSVEAWRDRVLTDSVAIPDEIQGETEPARRAAYAQLLYRSAELHYPTASLAAQMTGSPEWANHPVSAFFATYPDFEFGDERITYFLQAHPELPELFPHAQSAKADLLRVEQLFHL